MSGLLIVIIYFEFYENLLTRITILFHLILCVRYFPIVFLSEIINRFLIPFILLIIISYYIFPFLYTFDFISELHEEFLPREQPQTSGQSVERF